MTGLAAGAPGGGWAAGPPALVSGGWVTCPVWGPPGIRLSARAWLAVLPDDATPAGADWLPASWMTDGRVAADVAGLALTPGRYYMTWVRVDWPPELVVMRAGRVRAVEKSTS